LVFDEVIGTPEGYVFWKIAAGADLLSRLNHELYSGPLASFRDKNRTYDPHLTLARVDNLSRLEEALNAARAAHLRETVKVHSLTIECIGADEVSVVENVCVLTPTRPS
jgi:2'-5' RNA ligase